MTAGALEQVQLRGIARSVVPAKERVKEFDFWRVWVRVSAALDLDLRFGVVFLRGRGATAKRSKAGSGVSGRSGRFRPQPFGDDQIMGEGVP